MFSACTEPQAHVCALWLSLFIRAPRVQDRDDKVSLHGHRPAHKTLAAHFYEREPVSFAVIRAIDATPQTRSW